MTPEEIKALQDKAAASEAALAKANEELEKLKKGNPPPPEPDDEDLRKKAENERREREEAASKNKRVESAIAFNLSLTEYVKNNKGLIPDEIEGIIKKANEISYDSAIEKSRAVKQGIAESFFAVKENVELLTAPQKAQLDEFLKLTKNAKEDRVESLYDNVFEPALETLKKVRKAEELAKAKLGLSSDAEDQNVKRMIEFSQKHYLGKKEAG